MRRVAGTLVFTLCALVVPGVAFAQASITGTARDTSGAVLPGVTVEASSPALIEKVRTAVTDGTGQYRIVDLPPGTYDVSFTLPGFATVRREGVQLRGQFTATINADMRVGGLEETVTVTGESPIVDVQSAGQRQTLDRDVISSIPAPRLYHGLLQTVPGVVTSGTQDVGGLDGPVFKLFTVHGGRPNEGQIQVDGMSVGAALNGAGVSYYVSDVGTSEEVTVNLTGGSAETVRGGPVMNIVPRTGGNTFSGSLFVNGATGGMQGDNFDEELNAAGLRTPNELRSIWDVNGAFGGPIVRDRLWFYATARHQGNRKYVTNMFLNENAGDRNAWTYEPSGTRAVDGGTWKNASLRLTWQATERNKFNIFWDEQAVCSSGCLGGSITGGTPTTSPEAHQPTEAYPNHVQQLTWTSPVTNRLLLEAGYGNYLARWGGKQRPDFDPLLIPVNEQGGLIPGISYRNQLQWSRHWNGTHNWRASASYITGAHSFKVGHTGEYLTLETTNFRNDYRLAYRFNEGVPNRLTMYGDHAATTLSTSRGLGFYAQDRWTRGRVTLQGGIRYDRAWSSFPEQQVGPELFIPTAIVLPAEGGVDAFNDVTVRGAVVYDLFGNGRTALKANVGEYLEAVQNSGRYVATNPRNRISTQTFRNWNDANMNFVADCDLLNPAANGECGAWSNQGFGQDVFTTTFDPALVSGWNVRPNDWQFGVGIQHEVLPGMSVEVSYNRREFGNFEVTDDRSVGPEDFVEYAIVTPQDPRLPDGGGQTITDLFDLTPEAAFDRVRDEFVTLASNFGDWKEYWHGFDINANARLQNGVRVQGGVSAGRRVTDTCDVTPKIDSPSRRFCKTTEELRPQVRMLASYMVPRVDVQLSGTFQSVPGSDLAANLVVASGQTTLGRPLTTGVAIVNLIEPETLYSDRINQLDMRIGKLFQLADTRALVALDIFNVTNANAVENQIQTFGSRWLTPTGVLAARFVKISAQFDF